MKSFKGSGPLLIIAAIAVVIVLLAEPVSTWLGRNRSVHQGLSVGRVVSIEGLVRRLHGADSDLVAQTTDLHDGDRLQTGTNSHAVIILNSQDEFEIHPNSLVELKLWTPDDPGSPIYFGLAMGEPTLRKAGVRGKAYVVKAGRLYYPGQAATGKPMALTVLRNAPLDLELGAAEPDATGAGTGDEAAAAAAAAAPEEPAAKETPAAAVTTAPSIAQAETLSNEYIDETISGHQSFLQKCWLTHLKEAPKSKGQMTLQFEISRRGKVREARVADSSIDDEALKKCVLSVIERVIFRPYSGAEISLSYPINFE